MGLSFQRKLELAGARAKLQSQLHKLRVVESPQPRRRLRKVALLGSAIAVGAFVATVVCRRWRGEYPEVARDVPATQVDVPGQSARAADPDRQVAAETAAP
jgi:hypothetical protein